ncbi:proton-dependent oligopeptide transporter family protein [Tanacetum coccineum]
MSKSLVSRVMPSKEGCRHGDTGLRCYHMKENLPSQIVLHEKTKLVKFDRNFVVTRALVLLALSTLLSSNCGSSVDLSSCSPQLQVILFFISLYLVAITQGGHKPCVQAFGADQFDTNNPEEHKAKSSFFNWWYFGLCSGSTIGIFTVSYIQDNLSWGLGFGISSIIMGFALIIFLSGTMTYRFGEKTEERNAFVRIGRVFIKSARNWRTMTSALPAQQQACRTLAHQEFQQFRFLNKALVFPDGSNEDGTICSIDDVEETKAVLRLVPIWTSLLGFAIVFAQTTTLYTKQAATLDRSVGSSSFEVPAATLQAFINLFIIILIPIYDTMLVPLLRAITNKPSGITMLQRIGTGSIFSILLMVIAAIVETQRLKTAYGYGLVDDQSATIPMKVWWLLPQCLLAGVGDVFTIIGMQELFYEEMPNDLKSIGLAIYLSVLGIGSCRF